MAAPIDALTANVEAGENDCESELLETSHASPTRPAWKIITPVLVGVLLLTSGGAMLCRSMATAKAGAAVSLADGGLDRYGFLDRDQDGEMTKGELKQFLGDDWDDTWDASFDKADVDTSGKVDENELKQHEWNEKEQLELAFHTFDANSDGVIAKDEFKEFLGTKMTFAENAGFKKADKNGNGQEEEDEFMQETAPAAPR